MTDKPLRNVAASVSQRLTTISRQTGEDFQFLLTRYCIARLLYRLSQSKYSRQYILKGAMLFSVWGNSPYRPTRDLDLLGRGENSLSHAIKVFRAVCATPVENDGVVFDPETVRAAEIRNDLAYGGTRVQLAARLAQARLTLQIDIGYGDAVTPKPQIVEFPSVLDFPQARLLAYRPETVVAEKFQAMVALGIANSRMKDFYDLWTFAARFQFEGRPLGNALKATFTRRKTPLPVAMPMALTEEFHDDRAKQAQWSAFIRKNRLPSNGLTLAQVAAVLREFLMPPTLAVAGGQPFTKVWLNGGPWE